MRANLRHTGDGLSVELARANDAQRSTELRNENRIGRDERETPRPREPACDDRDLDVLALGRLVVRGLRGQRTLADSLRRDGDVVAKRYLLLRGERRRGRERQRGDDDSAFRH